MIQPKPDKRRDQYKIDCHEDLNEAKQLFYKKKHNQSVVICGHIIKATLIELYLRLLSIAPTGNERLNLVSLEMKIGNEKYGIERYTLGMLARFCKEADFFGLAEDAFDIDIGIAKQIDFSLLVQARNKAAHSIDGVSSESAGFVLFQTTTLFECLKIIIEDSEISDQVMMKMPLSAGIDDLSYLFIKLDVLKKVQQELAEIIHKQCSEAIEYARINPEDALFKLRKILEHISRQLFEANVGNPQERPLDKLMIRLREKGIIQNRIFKHMEVIKGFGNRGAHPGGESYNLKDVEAVFLSLIVVIDWYFETYR